MEHKRVSTPELKCKSCGYLYAVCECGSQYCASYWLGCPRDGHAHRGWATHRASPAPTLAPQWAAGKGPYDGPPLAGIEAEEIIKGQPGRDI